MRSYTPPYCHHTAFEFIGFYGTPDYVVPMWECCLCGEKGRTSFAFKSDFFWGERYLSNDHASKAYYFGEPKK